MPEPSQVSPEAPSDVPLAFAAGASPSRTSSTKTYRSVREMKNNANGAAPVAFGHFDTKYKCCCGSVHVKQGTMLIAWVTIVLCVVHVVTLLFSPANTVNFWLSLVSVVVQIICSILVLWGLRTERPQALIPNIILLAATVVACLAGFVLFAVAAFAPSTFGGEYIKQIIETEQEEAHKAHSAKFGNMLMTMVSVFMCIICALTTIITVWWLRVHLSCYTYLKDVRASRQAKYVDHANTMQKV